MDKTRIKIASFDVMRTYYDYEDLQKYVRYITRTTLYKTPEEEPLYKTKSEFVRMKEGAEAERLKDMNRLITEKKWYSCLNELKWFHRHYTALTKGSYVDGYWVIPGSHKEHVKMWWGDFDDYIRILQFDEALKQGE